jgi:hypothetical protein
MATVQKPKEEGKKGNRKIFVDHCVPDCFFPLMKNFLPPVFLFWPLLFFVKASADDVWEIETVVREWKRGIAFFIAFDIYTREGVTKMSGQKPRSYMRIVQGHVPWRTPVGKQSTTAYLS